MVAPAVGAVNLLMVNQVSGAANLCSRLLKK